MEMLLQRGEGEEPCMSECVSQTVLAVAIQCGPYCVWVRLGGQGVLRVSVWGGCISVGLRGLYVCVCLPGVMIPCVCVCVCICMPLCISLRRLCHVCLPACGG